MSIGKSAAFAAAILSLSATTALAQSRDQVQIAGSSTVLPYSSIVAEAFGENFQFPTPVVESGGTSSGMQRFCEGVGPQTIDIANASRQIRDGELETCQQNGVTEIIEVPFGYDGIVFASQQSGPAFDAFEPADIYNALAAQVVRDGEVVDNSYTNWSEFNSELPDAEITAFIPGTRHGTREVFEEKVLLEGCEASGAMQAFMDGGMDEDAAEDQCISVRTDGRAVDIDGDYTETLARLTSNPNGIGVFGLSFYEQNASELKVATMSGVEPTVDAIASGEYPVSRPLYFYIKKAHIGQIPGLKEYASFFVSDEVAGEGGPLAQYGLVPSPDLAEVQQKVENETTIEAASN